MVVYSCTLLDGFWRCIWLQRHTLALCREECILSSDHLWENHISHWWHSHHLWCIWLQCKQLSRFLEGQVDSSRWLCDAQPYKGLLYHIWCSSKDQHTLWRHRLCSVDNHCWSSTHLQIWKQYAQIFAVKTFQFQFLKPSSFIKIYLHWKHSDAGSPPQPVGHLQTALWPVGVHWALLPQGWPLSQGFTHWCWLQALLSGHSESLSHSPIFTVEKIISLEGFSESSKSGLLFKLKCWNLIDWSLSTYLESSQCKDLLLCLVDMCMWLCDCWQSILLWNYRDCWLCKGFHSFEICMLGM